MKDEHDAAERRVSALVKMGMEETEARRRVEYQAAHLGFPEDHKDTKASESTKSGNG